MSKEKGQMKLPSFDGNAENYEKCEINWAAFAEVWGLSDAFGDCLDPNMPDSSVSVLGEDMAGKLQMDVRKMNKRAMAYLALAFEYMKLLRLVTNRSLTSGQKVKPGMWCSSWPNDLQARVELRKRLINLKLRFDQDLSDLFEELAAIKLIRVRCWGSFRTKQLHLPTLSYQALWL